MYVQDILRKTDKVFESREFFAAAIGSLRRGDRLLAQVGGARG
jgi:hypothetical protein